MENQIILCVGSILIVTMLIVYFRSKRHWQRLVYSMREEAVKRGETIRKQNEEIKRSQEFKENFVSVLEDLLMKNSERTEINFTEDLRAELNDLSKEEFEAFAKAFEENKKQMIHDNVGRTVAETLFVLAQKEFFDNMGAIINDVRRQRTKTADEARDCSSRIFEEKHNLGVDDG